MAMQAHNTRNSAKIMDQLTAARNSGALTQGSSTASSWVSTCSNRSTVAVPRRKTRPLLRASVRASLRRQLTRPVVGNPYQAQTRRHRRRYRGHLHPGCEPPDTGRGGRHPAASATDQEEGLLGGVRHNADVVAQADLDDSTGRPCPGRPAVPRSLQRRLRTSRQREGRLRCKPSAIVARTGESQRGTDRRMATRFGHSG